MAPLDIPPSPGPGEAPIFEKRMGELRDQLDQKRGVRQRKRERNAPLEASAAAHAPEEGAGAAASLSSPSPSPPVQAAASVGQAAAPVQPEAWEEPYVRPPRKRPRRRRPEREAPPLPLSGVRLVALCAAVSALVSAGMCLAFGAGDTASLGTALATAGWSL